MLPQSQWVQTYVSPAGVGMFCFFCIHHSLRLLHSFIPPLTWGSLSCKGKNLMEKSYLGLSVPMCLSLSVQNAWLSSLCLFPSAAGGSISDDGWARHWSASLAGMLLYLSLSLVWILAKGFFYLFLKPDSSYHMVASSPVQTPRLSLTSNSLLLAAAKIDFACPIVLHLNSNKIVIQWKRKLI